MITLKVLVTGGCGFIGCSLVNRLVKDGHDVVVLDNLSKGSKERIHKKAVLIEGDIIDENIVSKAVKGCNAVFHLAAQTDVILSQADPESDFKTNFLGSKNVFSAAKSVNAKIVFASSAAVYGNAKTPINESADCKPISHYGKNKLKSEKLLDKNALILRLFNVYGDHGNSVINKFCALSKNKEPLTVYGTGLQSRDYVHVKDVIEAFLLGFNHAGTYNVGTGTEYSVLNVIDIITQITDEKPAIQFKPANEGEIERSRSDITKIKKELKWTPRVNLEEGIGMLLDQ